VLPTGNQAQPLPRHALFSRSGGLSCLCLRVAEPRRHPSHMHRVHPSPALPPPPSGRCRHETLPVRSALHPSPLSVTHRPPAPSSVVVRVAQPRVHRAAPVRVLAVSQVFHERPVPLPLLSTATQPHIRTSPEASRSSAVAVESEEPGRTCPNRWQSASGAWPSLLSASMCVLCVCVPSSPASADPADPPNRSADTAYPPNRSSHERHGAWTATGDGRHQGCWEPSAHVCSGREAGGTHCLHWVSTRGGAGGCCSGAEGWREGRWSSNQPNLR
jgi:hypothetical protein